MRTWYNSMIAERRFAPGPVADGEPGSQLGATVGQIATPGSRQPSSNMAAHETLLTIHTRRGFVSFVLLVCCWRGALRNPMSDSQNMTDNAAFPIIQYRGLLPVEVL